MPTVRAKTLAALATTLTGALLFTSCSTAQSSTGEQTDAGGGKNLTVSLFGTFGLDEAGLRGMRAALAGRPRAAAVVLRLPAGQVLEQSVALPLAAERDPERVLHYELDRLTPFAPDEVYWGWTVARRDRVRRSTPQGPGRCRPTPQRAPPCGRCRPGAPTTAWCW